MNAYPTTPSRLGGGTRRRRSLIRRDTELVSLDVFGLALDRLVIDPADVHRLVALSLAQGDLAVAGVYPALRYEAEQRATEEARERGGRSVALADITDHLEVGLAPLLPNARQVARLAVEREVALEIRLSRVGSEAEAVVAEAAERQIPVAFVADTYLPRDLVALMLRSAGLPAGIVLVSSHEGVTRYDGRLFRHLADRTSVDVRRITHFGPDPAIDVAMADRMGAHGVRLGSAQTEAVDRLRRGLWPASALDSVGLALAARRRALSACRDDDSRPAGPRAGGDSGNEPPPPPAAVRTPGRGSGRSPAFDLGYSVGGPLAVGFAAWIGTLIDRRRPNHVVLSGRIGPLVRDLLGVLRPDIAPNRLLLLSSTGAEGVPTRLAERFDRLADRMGLAEGDRLLLAELGWDDLQGLTVIRAVDERFRRVDVHVACLGRLRRTLGWEQEAIWAFSGTGHDPTTTMLRGRRAALEAVLGLEPADPERPGDIYRDATPGIVSGIERFARDLAPWFQLDPAGTSPALTEPALAVIANPDPYEAELITAYEGGGATPGPMVPDHRIATTDRARSSLVGLLRRRDLGR